MPIRALAGRLRSGRAWHFDPVVVRLLADHEPFVRFVERLHRVLLGEGSDVDDETLKARVLVVVTRRILDLPDQGPSATPPDAEG